MHLEQTLAKAKSGDAEAVNALLGHYQKYLLYRAEIMLDGDVRSRLDAADVVQQTMIRAAASLDAFRGATEPEFSAWMHEILRRSVENAHREQRAQKRSTASETPLFLGASPAYVWWIEPADGQPTPSQHAIEGERALALAQALYEIPETYALAVRLRHLRGMTFEDVARHLNTTPAAAAGLVQRGLAALRKKLEGVV